MILTKALFLTDITAIGKCLFFSTFFMAICCFSQTREIDSIHRVLAFKKQNTVDYKKNTSYINSLNDLAFQYINVDVDSTKSITERAKGLSEDIAYQNGIATSLLYSGIYFSEKGNGDLALEKYGRALSIAIGLDNKDLLFDIYNNQGLELYLSGEFGKALELHLQSLDLAKSNNNVLNISKAKNNIANLFLIQGEYEMALPYYQEATENLKNTQYYFNYALEMINLGNTLHLAGDQEKALATLCEVQPLLEEKRYTYLLGELYHYKGIIYYKFQEYDKALTNLTASMRLLQDTEKNQINLSFRYSALANVYLVKESYSEALKFATEAYGIAKNTNDLKGITNASETLYYYYKWTSDEAHTLRYLEEYKMYSDSLSNSQNKNGVLLFKAKSDFEKKQDELKAENEKALLSKQNKINTALWVIVILIATLIPLYLKHLKLGQLNSSITEKSKLLENRERELVKSNQTKDKLFSIIGFDLKGPIDSLRLLLNMHHNKEVTDNEFLEFSPKLNKDVGAVFFTLSNLLNWGRSKMKDEILEKKNFKVKPLVRDVIRFLESSSEEKNLKILNQIEEDAQVYADRNQIDVIIRNIINNAIKFTPANGTVKVISQDFEQKYRISVIDNGIGMDTDTCEKILDPNETYTTYGTENERGTGLGLSLCKELAEKNKGEIWIESTLGKGSTFHVLLPKAKAPKDILKAV